MKTQIPSDQISMHISGNYPFRELDARERNESVTSAETEANARLIAAAPDLLEACKELVKHLDSLPDDTEKCRHLKLALNNRAGDLMLAAIAKAEGGGQ